MAIDIILQRTLENAAPSSVWVYGPDGPALAPPLDHRICRPICKLGLFRPSWTGLYRAMPFAQQFAVDPWNAEETRIVAEVFADAALIIIRGLKLTQSRAIWVSSAHWNMGSRGPGGLLTNIPRILAKPAQQCFHSSIETEARSFNISIV